MHIEWVFGCNLNYVRSIGLFGFVFVLHIFYLKWIEYQRHTCTVHLPYIFNFRAHWHPTCSVTRFQVNETLEQQAVRCHFTTLIVVMIIIRYSLWRDSTAEMPEPRNIWRFNHYVALLHIRVDRGFVKTIKNSTWFSGTNGVHRFCFMIRNELLKIKGNA